MFEPTPTWPNVDFRQPFMWIEQSHIWPFRLNITFGWLQKLNPGYEICIISYQVNLSSEVSAMFNSLMPSLNIRSLAFVVFLGGFPSRCQILSSGSCFYYNISFRKQAIISIIGRGDLVLPSGKKKFTTKKGWSSSIDQLTLFLALIFF